MIIRGNGVIRYVPDEMVEELEKSTLAEWIEEDFKTQAIFQMMIANMYVGCSYLYTPYLVLATLGETMKKHR